MTRDSSTIDIDPRLLQRINQWLEKCMAAITPGRIKITVTWRGAVDQNIAAASGASKAKAGQSPHNCIDVNGKACSRAIDFAIIDQYGAYVKDGTDPRYAQAGEIAESVGLFWGGRWTEEHDECEPDYDHIQMADWRNVPTYDPATMGNSNASAPSV